MIWVLPFQLANIPMNVETWSSKQEVLPTLSPNRAFSPKGQSQKVLPSCAVPAVLQICRGRAQPPWHPSLCLLAAFPKGTQLQSNTFWYWKSYGLCELEGCHVTVHEDPNAPHSHQQGQRVTQLGGD